MQIEVTPQNCALKGEIEVPADKSIMHRALIIGALTGGKINIFNPSWGQDCQSSLGVVKALGCEVQIINKKHLILKAPANFENPPKPLNCGNSGTTMRLMSGVLSGCDFESILIGDESLSKRPMKRVIEPLSLMGAKIEANDNRSPLKIKGGNLRGINYKSKIASAQVKSAILLAGLNAQGVTQVCEPYLSRNHTELMLEYFGAEIEAPTASLTCGTEPALNTSKVLLKPSGLCAKDIEIPSDISSAAYFMAMGCLIKGSEILIKNVGLNPTRTGIIDVLKQMGAEIKIQNLRKCGFEQTGDIFIKHSQLKGVLISGSIIPRLIDELPVIAVIASAAQGQTVVKDAHDLRNKESDRISALVAELKKTGADIEETPDGFIINGKENLEGGAAVETYHDHRLAMSLYVAGLVSQKPVKINGFEWVNISFPDFLKSAKRLTVHL